MATEQELQATINSKFDDINSNFSYLDTQNKGSVKSITSTDATLTVTKGDGTSSTVTINNVAKAALADTATNATNAANATTADSATKAIQDGNGNVISTTYATKDEISGIDKFSIEVVAELPTSNISSTTIYLKTADSSIDGNLYTEYIYVNNKWEKLGEQTVDLTNYYTKTETNNQITDAIKDKADKATTLAGYNIGDAYTKTDIITILNDIISNVNIVKLGA